MKVIKNPVHDNKLQLFTNKASEISDLTATLDTRYLQLSGSLAEVTNHSHTVLTDIGTNTHAQIDTFIGTTVPATYANQALSNLASVAINTSLISDADSTDDLGSTSKQWANVYTDRLVSTISNLIIENDLSDGDITFKVNDGGVDTTVMTIDGATGNVGIGTTGPVTPLEIPGSITNSSAKFGAFELQTYSVNNAWLANNAYYNGGWKYRSDGYGAVQYFFNGGFAVNTAPSGIAGNTATFTTKFLVGNDGTSYFTGNLGVGYVSPGTAALAIAGNVGIGTTSPTYLLSLGGNSARTFWMERHTTANTAGNTLTVQAGGATSGATDKAGGDLLLYPGVSTGSGESGIQLYGCVAGVSGTADRTQTKAIQVLGNRIGFYAVTPVVRPTALTTQLTTITHTAPGTPDYAIQNFTQTTPFGFVTADEANTVLSVIANLQTRISELETKLQGLGLLT